MVSTPKLAELFELAERRTWRLVLVGDPLQFAAVGRSGMFGHLVDTFGAVELGRVHRFHHEWEAAASLRLRRGDVTVVEDYDTRGRLHGGTERQMRSRAVDAWWQTHALGETASLTAPTNASVVSLNIEAQRRRLDAGQLDPDGPALNVGPYRVHIGDVVATRANDRKLLTDRHRMVKNRDHWTITAVHRDGSITVEGTTGCVRLPKPYVAQHVELAYAETSHASQGRTVNRSFLYLDGPTGAAGIYVPLTRGRESNEAFVVVRGEESPADVVSEALTRTWIDRPAISIRAELREQPASEGRGREYPLTGAEVRRLLERAADLDTKLQSAQYATPAANAHKAKVERDMKSLQGRLGDREARLVTARATLEKLDRPLHRRRHRVEIDAARRQVASLPDDIAGNLGRLRVLARQSRQADKQIDTAATDVERVPQLAAQRALVQHELDTDVRARADALDAALPGPIHQYLGPKPPGSALAELWTDAAGRLAQRHAAFDLPSDAGLGQAHRLFGDDPYTTNRATVDEAVQRMNRSLGREVEIEPI